MSINISAEEIKKLQEENQKLKNVIAYYERKLIDVEKLVTLGKLIMGIAHEINTPIGAVNAANTSLQKVVPEVLTQMPAVVKNIPEDYSQLFAELMKVAMTPQEMLSSREERKKRKEIQKILDDNGVPGGRSLAKKLMKVGLYNNVEHFIPIFKIDQADQILELISQVGQIKMNTDNINIATKKIMKMVSAVKEYSYKEKNETPVPIDLEKNMETVLTLYHNVLKYGIEVIRDYDEDLPQIYGYPDELSQIWTNIIHNAAHAMDGKGTLKISIKKEDENWVSVSITDSGEGIDPQIKNKIFDQFFTTKEKGKGTGIGLYIVKKIVAKHRGKIKVKSKPGETTFTFYLPTNLHKILGAEPGKTED